MLAEELYIVKIDQYVDY